MNTDDKLYIYEDITDWQDEVLQQELILTDEDAIFEGLDQGISTAQLAKAAIVSRERGDALPDIMPLNQTAPAQWWSISSHSEGKKQEHNRPDKKR